MSGGGFTQTPAENRTPTGKQHISVERFFLKPILMLIDCNVGVRTHGTAYNGPMMALGGGAQPPPAGAQSSENRTPIGKSRSTVESSFFSIQHHTD
jgi:hypothetical protein